jgi:hypothetical protein
MANVKSVAFTTTEGGIIETDKLIPLQRSFEINSTVPDDRRSGGAVASSGGECSLHREHAPEATHEVADAAQAASRFAQQGGLAAASPTPAVFASQHA